MGTKSKSISGLQGRINRVCKYYSDTEKHTIVQAFLNSKQSKQEIWRQYTGHGNEHGQIIKWMRALGYDLFINNPNRIFTSKDEAMKKKKVFQNTSEDSFENLRLQKRIAELEAQLKDSEMKAIAFSTMVDIAEKEFNIPIRKKFNTKPSKK